MTPRAPQDGKPPADQDSFHARLLEMADGTLPYAACATLIEEATAAYQAARAGLADSARLRWIMENCEVWHAGVDDLRIPVDDLAAIDAARGAPEDRATDSEASSGAREASE